MSSYTLNETTIFNAVTAEVTTPVGLDLRTENTQNPVTLTAKGLAGAETISIWFSQDGGQTFTEYMTNGNQLTLSADDNVRACYSNLYLGFTKTASVGAVTLLANLNSRG